MRKHKFAVWVLIFFLPTFVFILCPAAYVFLVDPLWQWNHPWHLKRWHRPFNERLQKTNYLASHKVNIDTLIVGSSRSSYFNPEWLGTKNGFNYAVSSGKPQEFSAHINYVKKRSRQSLKLVLIESSFTGALKLQNTFEMPSTYINSAEDRPKKFRNLFSRSAYRLAREARTSPVYNDYLLEGSRMNSYRYPYRRYENDDAKRKVIDYDVKTYRENVYNKEYDESFSKYISDIHREVGESDFIVWTTPVSKQFLKLLYDMGIFPDYERWLRELVSEFGCVYHFAYPNNITMDNASFNDAHHPTEATAKQIIRIIKEMRKTDGKEDTAYGGIVLTPENIEHWISVFHRQFAAL